jgi:hypothetical protein
VGGDVAGLDAACDAPHPPLAPPQPLAPDVRGGFVSLAPRVASAELQQRGEVEVLARGVTGVGKYSFPTFVPVGVKLASAPRRDLRAGRVPNPFPLLALRSHVPVWALVSDWLAGVEGGRLMCSGQRGGEGRAVKPGAGKRVVSVGCRGTLLGAPRNLAPLPSSLPRSLGPPPCCAAPA